MRLIDYSYFDPTMSLRSVSYRLHMFIRPHFGDDPTLDFIHEVLYRHCDFSTRGKAL